MTTITGDPILDNIIRVLAGVLLAAVFFGDKGRKREKDRADEMEKRYEEQRKITHQLRERLQACEIELAELRMKTNFEPTERLLHELIDLMKSGAFICSTGKLQPLEQSLPSQDSSNS